MIHRPHDDGRPEDPDEPEWYESAPVPGLRLRLARDVGRAWDVTNEITILETRRTRMILDRGNWLTILARDPARHTSGARGQTIRIVKHTSPVVGEPWTYVECTDGRELRRTTARIQRIRQLDRSLAAPAAHDDDRAGVRSRRHHLETLWSLGWLPWTVTVRLHTTGAWTGTWVIHDGSRCHFLPDDQHQAVREFPRIWLETQARIHATLWLGHEIAPDVWVPVDDAGAGTLDWITVDELDADLPDQKGDQ